MKLLRTLTLAALLPGLALAAAPMETVQPVDGSGVPLGTLANPLYVSGGGGTVMQGPAATDTLGNRWPVLAYQGGSWTVGLSGSLPGFAATPTFNLGTLNGAATATNQTSEIAALTAANQRSSFVTDAAGVAVAASGTFSGTLRDAGASPSPYTKCSTNLFSTQNGSLALYISDDGTNFTQAAAVTVSANVPQTISVQVVARYCKMTLFNGATAATVTAHTALSVN